MYDEIIKQKIDKAVAEKGKLRVLGIETSCDETAAAVVENGRHILSNIISTQIPLHQRFGGVVPEVASRNHTLAINGVIESALESAGLGFNDIDAVAVTYGAGLIGALLVGVSTAKALSLSLNIPLIKVNHIQAHICANYLEFGSLKPPFMSLVASGGHTAIVEVKGYNEYKVAGTTKDDAIGEAFDKVARLLGLPYPGGPSVDKMAKEGVANINFFKNEKKVNKDYSLSYSGLKTAVINHVHNLKQKGEELPVADICASFTKHAVDLLSETLMSAIAEYGYDKVVLAGGVAANSYLREKITSMCGAKNIGLFIPPSVLCTDNAAMVASRGYFSLIEKQNIADMSLNADSSIAIDAN